MNRSRYHSFTSNDRLSLDVVMTRTEMGERVLLGRSPKFVEVPFTLGPWKGTAQVSQGSDLKTDNGSIMLAFDLELLPDEQITLAKALEEFFGAEIQK